MLFGIVAYMIGTVALVAINDDGEDDGVYWPWEETPAEAAERHRHYQDIRRQFLGQEDV